MDQQLHNTSVTTKTPIHLAQTQTQRRPLSAIENALVGGISGTLEVLIQQPHVAWKNALQEKRPFTLHPSFLYRGVIINASSIAPITAVQFAVNGTLSSILSENGKRALTEQERLLAAAIAGAASAFVSTPAELLMIQQQKTGKSLLLTAGEVKKNFGLRIFYKGLLPTAIRESLFTCGYLGLGPVIKEQLMKKMPEVFGDQPVGAALLGSIIAGLMAAALTQPADTIKTRMQADVRKDLTVYKKPLQSAKLIIEKEGGKTLFSGLVPRGLRMIGAVFILGLSGDYFTNLIHEARKD